MSLFSVVTVGILLAAPVQVAAPGFNAHGMNESAGTFYSDQVAQQLSFHGLKVMTHSEVLALLGNNRQKQLLGCNDDSSSCALELAGALGTDGLLLGEVAKVGDTYRLSVRIISSKNGEKLSSAVVSSASENSLLEAFSAISATMANEAVSRARGEPAVASSVSTLRTGTRRFFWIPAAVGALALGAGTFEYFQAKARYDRLRSSETLIEPDPTRLRSEGQTAQTLAFAGFGVGAAALLGAGGLLMFGSEATVETGVVLVPDGGGISISGVLP
ncbi:MAG: hypothetical protein K1X64_04425 [Myxococcaceae bacterium]|nr:hypothetical protein [Myxococcaceae bacterium]